MSKNVLLDKEKNEKRRTYEQIPVLIKRERKKEEGKKKAKEKDWHNTHIKNGFKTQSFHSDLMS